MFKFYKIHCSVVPHLKLDENVYDRYTPNCTGERILKIGPLSVVKVIIKSQVSCFLDTMYKPMIRTKAAIMFDEITAWPAVQMYRIST